ncbi:MAG: class I SAM-dependent methyltransferase [Promethearchaeota archaeon]
MNKKKEFLLSKEEKQILDSILSLELYPSANEEEVDETTKLGEILTPTLKNICKRGKLIHKSILSEKTSKTTIEHLNTKDLIQKNDDSKGTHPTCKLTSLGRLYAKQLRQERIRKQFDDALLRCEGSKAYSSFCYRVFGKDLSQANMMDIVQLDKLLEVLNLTSSNRVLDLACGVGRIAEYISDITQAFVLGIDIATRTIKRAQERTRKKRNRLEFTVGNINNLPLDKIDVDTVIGIASVHYIEDVNKVIGELKEILPPNGQMGFFTFQYCSKTDSPEILLPENTELGQVLRNHDLRFQTWDFTDKEIEIRKKQLRVAQELMQDFQREGNKDLCVDRIEECEIDLPRLETGKKRRYLYHVQLT